MKKVFIFIVSLFSFLNGYSQSGFISIQNGNFVLNGQPYNPVIINYSAEIRKIYAGPGIGTYYMTPASNYSSDWTSTPVTGLSPEEISKGGGRFDIGSVDSSLHKLGRDMKKIKNLGFNGVRICNIAPTIVNNVLQLPSGCSYPTYFTLVKQLLDSLNKYNLKAIILVEASYENPDIYRDYLDKFSKEFKDNTTIFAYDLKNEPDSKYSGTGENDKYLISNWIDDWYFTIKKNAPNHLVTIGNHLADVKYWDPVYMHLDFGSYHVYGENKDVNGTLNNVNRDLYWASKTMNKPWIIGETGYSGTNNSNVNDPLVGNEDQQKLYADLSMQRAKDCNCKGYSWWQYQEMALDPVPFQLCFGLITRYPEERMKPVASSFINAGNIIPHYSNCTKPSNYYNKKGYTIQALTGKVVDVKGNPIPNAYIILADNVYISFDTFSDDNGNFAVYVNNPVYPYTKLIVGYPGYATYYSNSPDVSGSKTIVLKKVLQNNWTKRWTNNGNGLIDTYNLSTYNNMVVGDFNKDGISEHLFIPNSGNINMSRYTNGKWTYIWSGSITSAIYLYQNNLTVGDFDGDGQTELLGVNGSWLKMFKFTNGSWQTVWSNNGSTTDPVYQYRDKYISGDFDGNGKTEILGVANNGWITMFQFNNGHWDWVWSNNGSTSTPIYPYRNGITTGDFDGDRKTELLGVDTNGWITMFRFNSSANWDWVWSNSGSTSTPIYPYRNKLVVGNFDNDINDEILGISSWATKFDFSDNNFQWSWSTYESAMLSDWTVNANAKLLFFKSYKNTPNYLLTINGNNADIYAMDNFIQGTSSLNQTQTSHSYVDSHIIGDTEDLNKLKSVTVDNKNITDSQEIIVYPNPTSQNFTLVLPTEDLSLLKVFSSSGALVNELKITSRETKIDCSQLKKGLYFLKVLNARGVYNSKIEIIR